MIPVEQTQFVTPDHEEWADDGMNAGNCYAASVASLLEVELAAVPNVVAWPDGIEDPLASEHGPFADRRLRRWLRQTHGLDVGGFEPGCVWTEDDGRVLQLDVVRDDLAGDEYPLSYVMAQGLTARETQHVVVLDERLALAHDPYPGGGGLEVILWISMLRTPYDPPPPDPDPLWARFGQGPYTP